MKRLIFLFFLCFAKYLIAQTPNYAQDIAPILFNKCTQCHHNGGIAPFSLMNYQQAVVWAPQMVLAVVSGEMPPWPPDTTFQRYAHERILSISEIDKIVNWNNNGVPQGDSTLTPPQPIYMGGAVLANPDFTLNLPIYTSTATSNDEYVCLRVSTNFPTDMFVQAAEIIPGNMEIVHHVLAFIDTGSGQPITQNCTGVAGELLLAYVPGASPMILPNGGGVKMGVRLPAGSDIIAQMHYPAGSAGLSDSTKINLFFYPIGTTGIREVYNNAILQNWQFAIPPNISSTFSAEYPPSGGTLPIDVSVLSVAPHMHLIGEQITSFAIDPNNDTIPFIKINNWDFHWQGGYNFKKILKLPSGSRLYATATYNNTISNPNNPNNPPQWVFPGEATTDEMFLVFFQYLLYQTGDENLNLDSLLSTGVGEPVLFEKLTVFPNPSSDKIFIHTPFPEEVELSILDLKGKIVCKTMVRNEDGISISNLASGEYFCWIVKENTIFSTKFIKLQ